VWIISFNVLYLNHKMFIMCYFTVIRVPMQMCGWQNVVYIVNISLVWDALASYNTAMPHNSSFTLSFHMPINSNMLHFGPTVSFQSSAYLQINISKGVEREIKAHVENTKWNKTCIERTWTQFGHCGSAWGRLITVQTLLPQFCLFWRCAELHEELFFVSLND